MELEKINEFLSSWSKGVIEIGKIHREGGDYRNSAKLFLDTHYAFEETDVLFKPTKVSKVQFRSTFDQALSYFVATNNECEEDKGFAINPWIDVRFENSNIILQNNLALAMGNYFFTQVDGSEVKVEYTFGYFVDKQGQLKINLHHSSLPFN